MKFDERKVLATIDNSVIRHMNDQPHLFGQPKEKVTMDSLKSKSRYREIVISRFICMYICDIIFNGVLNAKYSDQYIADFYGKDRGMVIHARKVIKDLQESSPQILDMVAYCIDKSIVSTNIYQPSPDCHRWYTYLHPQTTIF